MAFQGYQGEGAPDIGRAVGRHQGGKEWGGVGSAIGGAIGQWVKGGLTKPGPTGAEAGAQSRDYLNAAYPGTNPWEQLGTAGQGGPMAIAERQQKTQKDVAGTHVAAQTSIAANQVDKDLAVARIHGRSVAVNNAHSIGIGQIERMGDYITGERSGQSRVSGESTSRMDAWSKRMDAWTRSNALILKRKEVAASIGQKAGNPASASLQALAAQAFDIGYTKSDLLAIMDRNFNKLRAAGVAVSVISELGNLMRGFIGRLQVKGNRPSSVRGTSPKDRVRPPKTPKVDSDDAFYQRLQTFRRNNPGVKAD